jgi:CHAT domain-containing protein/predicted negative regulator of RcsB-dependent stress response
LVLVGGISCSRQQLPFDINESTLELLPSVGEAIELELTGGAWQTLRTDLDASWYLQLEVESGGVNLDLVVVGPTRETSQLGRSRRHGPTLVSVVAEEAGAYCFGILCAEPEDVVVPLTVRVVDSRPARAGDRDRVRAERLFAEAEALRLEYEADAGVAAIDRYRSALDLWKRAGELEEAARTGQRIGAVLERTGDLENALLHYQDGLALVREWGEPPLESQLLSAVAGVRLLLGDHKQAEEDCREALILAEQSGSHRGQALALNCLGEVDYHRGKLHGAVGFYRRALPLWQALGDHSGQAQTLLYLGYSHSDLSEFDRASSFYQRALSLWRLVPDRRGEAQTLIASGRLHFRIGEYQSALDAYNQAMQLVATMGDLVWQASVNAGLGSVYRQMGDHQQALVYWNRALGLFQKAGLRMAELEVLNTIGEIHLLSSDHVRAISNFERTLALSRELENRHWEANSLRLLGLAYQSMGESGRAVTHFKASLAIRQTVQDRRFEAYTHGNLGETYQSQGKIDLALLCFKRGLKLSRAARDRAGEAMGLFNLARTASQQGELAEARQHIEQTLQIAESLRSAIESRELRTSYLASIQVYFKLHIEVLMQLHRRHPSERFDTLAFETSERARARSLLDSLIEAGVDVRQGVDSELLAHERQLQRAIEANAERQMRLSSQAGSESETEALADEIHDLTIQLDQLQAKIRGKSPTYAALTQPEPLSLDKAQQQVLDDNTLVLEYSLGEERSYLWAVEHDAHFSIELAPRAEIEQACRDVYQLLTARLPIPDEPVRQYRPRVKEADASYWQAAGRLSDMLLAPVADRLTGKRIVVVGDGAMHYLPFAALPLPDRVAEQAPVIVENEVAYLPSVSAFAVHRAESIGREEPELAVAVLADPVFELDDPRLRAAAARRRQSIKTASNHQHWLSNLDLELLRGTGGGITRLTATRQEADAILAAAPEGATLRALDFDASREMALSPRLRQYQIVHFATHGIVNNEQPGLSGLIFSMVDEYGRPQNGFLRLHDIYNLDLPVDLVVLSACSSALGKPVEGEGLVGIMRGFMYAGARRIVASLWRVDDRATAALMSRFYREMLQNNRSPAAALRHAQLEMWRQTEWRHPFYWAAFVLQGEWQ